MKKRIIDKEQEEEWARETQEGLYESWLRDNRTGLTRDFCDICYPQEFEDYCKQEFESWKEDTR